jgi:hypothetical protein
MRILIAIVVAAALAWSGWWWVQASARDRAVEGWLAARRADGWVAEAADVSVSGFPNRVDLTVEALDLADPEAGWAWRADAFQVLSLSYRPHHFIAVLPGEQVVSTPYETVHATSETLRGSVIFVPTTRLELDHMTFEIEAMRLVGETGWEASIDSAILATRRAAGEDAPPFAHDLALNAEGLALPAALTARVDPRGLLPATIGTLALDATLAFDRPWDRMAIEGDNPVLEQVEVKDVSLTWGKLDVRGRGTLAVDSRGYAEGRLDLRARNWQDMIEMAEAGGALDPTLAGALRAGLELVARLSGDSSALDVPLTFEDGRTRLGPIVIGPAPVLARRG